jgi:hypothetical protein
MVASQSIQRKTKNYLTRREEDDGPDTRNDPNYKRQTEQTGLGSKPLASKLKKLGEPPKWM